MGFQRPNKMDYYIGIARAVSARSTCLRRQYGAVIVKNGKIVSTGYNGSASGSPNCCDTGECVREINHIPHGERYELCAAVHAEANAIINGNRDDMDDSTLYLYGESDGVELVKPEPCLMCERMIRNAGIRRVIVCDGAGHSVLYKDYGGGVIVCDSAGNSIWYKNYGGAYS